MGLYLGGLIIGRICASEIWGGGLFSGGLIIGILWHLFRSAGNSTVSKLIDEFLHGSVLFWHSLLQRNKYVAITQ